MKKKELLKKFPSQQLIWIKNQLEKNNDTFLDLKIAKNEYQALIFEGNGSPTIDAIERFVNKNLSITGEKKLVRALRVKLNRDGTNQLQVEISKENLIKLNKLIAQTKKTKKEVINSLIKEADLFKTT